MFSEGDSERCGRRSVWEICGRRCVSMPRDRGKPKETPEKLAQNRLMWGTFGKGTKISVASWDPKQVEVVQAILEVVASGSTVVLRPGSGGGALGIAIWEGDTRWPPVWCYTSEEMDAWANGVLERVEGIREDAAD
jgi:hypothetical protein